MNKLNIKKLSNDQYQIENDFGTAIITFTSTNITLEIPDQKYTFFYNSNEFLNSLFKAFLDSVPNLNSLPDPWKYYEDLNVGRYGS